ncbi:MAG: hypothetical protein H7841_18350, partial [Magnetospirillum sp. WYHS-4]
VGPGRRNDPRDVIKVQSLLGNGDLGSFGRYQGPLGTLQDEDVDGIKSWQGRNRLRVDGVLDPGGETIRSLRKSMGNLLGAFRAPTPDEVDEHHAGTRGLAHIERRRAERGSNRAMSADGDAGADTLAGGAGDDETRNVARAAGRWRALAARCSATGSHLGIQ